MVPGNFPIGCFPFVLASFASNDSTTYDEFGCVRNANKLAIYQNNNLQAALNTLRREFPGVAIIYADYYNAFLKTFRLAPFFGQHLHTWYYNCFRSIIDKLCSYTLLVWFAGFDRTTLLTPCCRSRQFNPLSPEFCGNPTVPVCPNPQQYIHWDGLHLTQEAYHRISQFVVPNILPTIICLGWNMLGR